MAEAQHRQVWLDPPLAAQRQPVATRARYVQLLAVLLLHGCSAQPEAGGGRLAQPIRGGAVDQTHTMVGVWSGGDRFCGGVLVGERTVLTTARCVDATQGAQFTVEAGTYESDVQLVHPAVEVDTLSGLGRNDLALIYLTSSPPFAPALLAARPPVLGQSVTLVGSGPSQPSGDDRGVRRSASVTVSAVGPDTFETDLNDPAGICFGDAGGGVFASVDGTDVLVGLLWAGWVSDSIPDCSGSINIRIDAHREWLDRHVDRDPRHPHVVISAPTEGARVVSPLDVELDVMAGAEPLDSVTCLVDGHAQQTLLRASRHVCRLALSTGEHEIEAVALAQDGAEGSDAVRVLVVEPDAGIARPDDAGGTDSGSVWADDAGAADATSYRPDAGVADASTPIRQDTLADASDGGRSTTGQDPSRSDVTGQQREAGGCRAGPPASPWLWLLLLAAALPLRRAAQPEGPDV